MFNKGFESFVDFINSMGGSMRQFYITRYEGPQAGISFRVEEPLTGLGIASETAEGNDFSACQAVPVAEEHTMDQGQTSAMLV